MKKTLIIILILVVISTVIFFYYRSKAINTKAKAIKVIADYTGSGEGAYDSFDESYLIARAKAIQSKSDTFQDGDNTYTTTTGMNITTKVIPVVGDTPTTSDASWTNSVKNWWNSL